MCVLIIVVAWVVAHAEQRMVPHKQLEHIPSTVNIKIRLINVRNWVTRVTMVTMEQY